MHRVAQTLLRKIQAGNIYSNDQKYIVNIAQKILIRYREVGPLPYK